MVPLICVTVPSYILLVLEPSAPVSQMTQNELAIYLTESMKFNADDIQELESKNMLYIYRGTLLLFFLERLIDGKSFIGLSREDFSVIFSSNEKFLVGSRLYKIAQKACLAEQSSPQDTQSLLNELSDLEGDFYRSRGSYSRVSTPMSFVSRGSTPTSLSRASTPSSSLDKQTQPDIQPRKKRRVWDEQSDPDDECVSRKFCLPVFSPIMRQCIQKDAFYTSAQRNCLIKEACTSLQGYCWERGKPITNEDKRELAVSLYKLAPKSLDDSESTSAPEV